MHHKCMVEKINILIRAFKENDLHSIHIDTGLKISIKLILLPNSFEPNRFL